MDGRTDGRMDRWMDRWMDEWMAGLDRRTNVLCAIDYKKGPSRDRQGKSGKVMQTNGNVITFILERW